MQGFYKSETIISKIKKLTQTRRFFYYWLISLVLVSFILCLIFFCQYSEKIAFSFNSWRTPHRIVVFESDDWGKHGLSQESLQKLAANLSTEDFLIPLTYLKDLKWLRDAMESEDDLERLYSIFEKHKDSRGATPFLLQI